MKRTSLIQSLALVFSAIPFISFAEAPKVAFEENKNQYPTQVKFKADIPGGALFLEQNTFTYLYHENINWHDEHRNEAGGPVKQKFHSFKVNFENSNPFAEVSGNNRYSWHRNYYLGNDQSKWASNVPVFSQVYYKDLYQGIDMQIYNEANNLKYDIIVHAGANPKNIKLNYTGTDGMHIENGHLFIKTSVYDLMEQKPYAYQEIDGIKKQIVCSYVLRNNTLTFALGDYDHSLPLIIDPTLIACTYAGSFGDNWGYTATYDASQNIYMAGIVAKTGYPATSGSWDQSFNGGMTPPSANVWPMDISISKMNPTGTTLLYATYYGGTSNEQPHSLMVNSANELYVVGRTNSTNFPISNGTTIGTSVAYDATYNGGYDIIVGKFNSLGNILASTFVGSPGDDCVNFNILWAGATSYGATKFNYADDGRSELILDANSNVYVAACSRSAGFPTTAGAYQATFGGTQDAVVFKMNSTLSAMIFSTYLGGTGTDAAYGLKLDNSNNVYVTGGSTGGFPTTAGVLQPTYNGGTADAFIAVLNSTGTALSRSTYLGTAAYDQAYLIEIDANGDIYVFGQTKGTYPVVGVGGGSVYSNPNSGQFIHKVTGNMTSTVFSTVIGTGFNAVNIAPTAFLVDSCQTIYLSGWGRSTKLSADTPFPSTTSGLPVTANAIQPTTDGKDFYFMVLEPDAKGLAFATFFGEIIATPDADHVDGGTSRFDKRGVIYHACCASCGGTSGFPTIPGSYSTVNNGSAPTNSGAANCNQAIIKMAIAPNPISNPSITGSTKGCAPFQVCFTNTGSTGTDYLWDFGDGGISTQATPCYTYSFSGTFKIILYAIDSIGICGYIDTSYVTVTVGEYPTLALSQTNILCNAGVGSATVTATGGILPLGYAWTPSGGNTNIAASLGGGTYSITVTDSSGCASTQSVTITEPAALTVSTSSTGADCGMFNGSATATVGGGVPGYSYSWQPSGGTSAIATGISSGTYSLTVTDANGCTKVQTVNVPLANGPTVTATAASTILCNGTNTGSATSSMTNGTVPYTYLWTPGNQTTQAIAGLAPGTYVVVITDAAGCSAQSSVTITEPPAIVPTVNSTNIACFGGSDGTATISATGGTGTLSYSWGTTPAQSTQNITGLLPGTYVVIVTDGNGCTIATSATITQPATGVAVTTSSSGTNCGIYVNGVANASAVTGTGSAPYTYTWLPGGQAGPSISNVAGGTYTVIVTDANGCTTSGITTLPTNVKPDAYFSSAPTISCEGIYMQFTDSSINALSWYWDFAGLGYDTIQNPAFIFPYNASYNVTLIVTNPPCSDTLTQAIDIGDVSQYGAMGAANVFTPNDDGMNDCFLPTLGPGQDTLKYCIDIEVYDRWGVKMFESKGTDKCWNGNNMANSKPANDGTYYYIAKLGESTIRGYVTLARHF